MLEGQIGRAGANIPELNSGISGSRRENVFGGRVEQNLSDFPASC